MKKVYQIKTFSCEINIFKLRQDLKYLSNEEIRSYLHEALIYDQYPNEGEMFDSMEEAKAKMLRGGIIRNMGKYYIIEADMIEAYTVDDEGDFFEGSDYDYIEQFADEEIEALKSELY